jgi:hypothetical protein
VAVPVSIVGTFGVMLGIGYTANTVSLLALVLAIGIGHRAWHRGPLQGPRRRCRNNVGSDVPYPKELT